MKVKNREALKQEIKNRVDVYVKEFPIYFAGNIIINLVLGCLFLAGAVYVAGIVQLNIVSKGPVGVEGIYYGIAFMLFMASISRFTLRNLRRSFRALKLMAKGTYDFEIEDYEIDHAAELIEKLPMKKGDVEKMKISLSFGKIIDIVEVIGLISCRKGVYDVRIVFDCQVDELMIEGGSSNLDKKLIKEKYISEEPAEKHSGYWEEKQDDNSFLDKL